MNIIALRTEQQPLMDLVLTEHFENVTDNEPKEAIEKRIPQHSKKHYVGV